ncbi:MAG TPA: type II toxin-antitoxin system HicB family antitoxin [Saprospiraceae bacterium]|jgi:predicted RNase H-like HicB family nuclease|nr:type II toxin-antitoxin system HicB family antitoxin [Saprospiraceae bacterium]HRP41907.1 type II toxin-antitoxin system HicB family antitoxin [Saprospiraceae bacterium]
MKSFKYIITKEGKFYVSRCLNVEVSSFGKTLDEAKSNLKEALDLYFEDNNERFDLQNITETIIGEMKIKVS